MRWAALRLPTSYNTSTTLFIGGLGAPMLGRNHKTLENLCSSVWVTAHAIGAT